MTPSLRWLRKRIFGISPDEATFARRGFSAKNGELRDRLEKIGVTFLHGYNTAHNENNSSELARSLDEVELEFRGFAYEGASMALALQDYIMRWKTDRFQNFVRGPASPHIYMAHVGAGWVYARFNRGVENPVSRMDPLLGWLAVDGYGFHNGYFHWPLYIEQQAAPKKLGGYALRVFDQGLGRSMWFVRGADATHIIDTVNAFPESRQPDLWSGVGLACAYAGGVDQSSIEALRDASGRHIHHLAQGVAFAAGARHRAENMTDYTELASRIICGTPASEAAELTTVTREKLPYTGPDPAFEIWRKRIQEQYAREAAIPS